jgi:hypothetical protein
MQWDQHDECQLSLSHNLSNLVAVQHLGMRGTVAVGRVESLFALTRLTSLDGPSFFTTLEGEGADVIAGSSSSSSSSKALVVPQQWRDRLQRLTWNEYDARSIAMLSQLTSLTFLDLHKVQHVTPDLCRYGSGHALDVTCGPLDPRMGACACADDTVVPLTVAAPVRRMWQPSRC